MGYEIDFLAVGEKERCGDAIVLRCGQLTQEDGPQTVTVIDGGTQETGAHIVEHIKKYYNSDRVNLVVSTHPDADHTSGLLVVLEELQVDKLWMHLPWNHSSPIVELLEDGRVTKTSVEERIRKSLENAWELQKLAEKRSITITEPFAGLLAGSDVLRTSLRVLGPSRSYYQQLLPAYRVFGKESVINSIEKLIGGITDKAKSIVEETWHVETINDDDSTSAENNSSVVLHLNVEGKSVLFTGDAGITGLAKAADYADSVGINIRKADLIQVPHHGSKRNAGPTILDRIIGPKLATQNGPFAKRACVSASREGLPKHPSKRVTNAFWRRGAKVYVTQGTSLRFPFDAPDRARWTTVDTFPFDPHVGEDE